MKNIDSKGHVTGKSIFLDDIPTIQGTLYGAVFDSPFAHGHIESVDYTKALALPGVIKVLTHEDIPGGPNTHVEWKNFAPSDTDPAASCE